MTKRNLSLVMGVLISSLLSGCNPVKTLDDSTENKMTTQEALEAYKSLKLELDPMKDIPEYKRTLMPLAELPKLEKYLNGLLDQIIAKNSLEGVFVSKKPAIKVSVDSSFNAVTLKNGLIIINTGMLTQLETEVELQSVIAHELMHVLNEDHQKDELQKVTDKGLQLGMAKLESQMAGLSESEMLKGLPSILGQQILDDTINALAFTKWNREQELHADLTAIQLLHQAGLNEKYMLKFLNKRKEFEEKNYDLFQSQNNENSKFIGSLTQMFSGLGAQNESKQEDDAEKSNDSFTGKYYSANTRIEEAKSLLKNQIGKTNLNYQNRSSKLSKVMPDYERLKGLYAVSKVNVLLSENKPSEALRVIRKVMNGDLKDNSYLRMVLASIREAQNERRKAQINREVALKDPNATLSIYSNVIAYYDSRNDKAKALELLDKVNKELDYPNAYLPITLKLQKKYGIPTGETEVQCVRTVDVSVVKGCQKALGRALKFNSGDLLNTVVSSDAENDEQIKTSEAQDSIFSGLKSALPF